MSKPWDHLPNANHIDRFVASWNRYPDIWNSAWNKCSYLAGYELRYQAYYKAKAKCKEMGRWDIWHDSSIPNIYAVIALIAYDDCAHYLEYTSRELTTIALLGVAPAVLLLQLVIAFEEIAKISNR